MNLPSLLTPPIALWLQIVAVTVWLGIVGLTAEVLHRTKLSNPEVVRKVVHIGVGNIILLAWWMKTPLWLGVGASVLFSAIAFLSYRLPILPSINGVGRKSLGTFFYAISIGILMGCFWLNAPYFAVLGVLVMTWGDGLAAIMGQSFGKHPYTLWEMNKSWEGSFTMAIASFLISSIILVNSQGNHWQSWLISIAIALFATGLEAFSKYGIDNLTVPLGSAFLGVFLTYWWQ